MIWLLAVLLITAAVDAQVNRFEGTCSTPGSFFQAGLGSCGTCPSNATYVASRCVCPTSFETDASTVNGELVCTDCRTKSLALSPISKECRRCGTLTFRSTQRTTLPMDFNAVPYLQIDLNGTSVAMFNPTYNVSGGSCTCPRVTANGTQLSTELVESLDGFGLQGFVCITCFNGSEANSTAIPCQQLCPNPKTWDSASRSCICPKPTFSTDSDGRCIVTSLMDVITATIGLIPLTIPVRNLDTKGSPGASQASWRIASYTATSAYWCQQGNDTACNMLANLCVLSLYDLTAAPCVVYRYLQSRESCRGLECEVPQKLPWLFYLRSSSLILQNDARAIPVSLEPTPGKLTSLQFVLSSYSWNGTWLGNTVVTDQFDLCDLPAAAAEGFFQVGANRQVYCYLNLQWYSQAPETVFHDLFMLDQNGAMVDVPVLLDWGTSDIEPRDIFDSVLFRAGSGLDGSPVDNGYRRRFYLYDNVGAVAKPDTPPTVVTYARRVYLIISLVGDHSSRIFTPLLIVQYASLSTIGFSTNRLLKFGQMKQLKTNLTSGLYTGSGVTRVKYSMSGDETERALMITLTTFCCICFFTSWIRVYFWMRRQQDLVPGFGTLFRWFLYACNHVSNIFFLIVVLTSGYFYLFYKHQASVDYLLPDDSTYLFAMLYTATTAKGVVVIYKIIEQCKIDWFVVDWERSRGMLLRENKEAGVTMWRSTFVANELNELQVFRYWSPLFSMVIIMSFLEGGSYVDLAMTIPRADVNQSDFAYPHKILRVAVDAFFWIIVPMVFYVLQHHLWYRFLAVHPLRGFIDLCSVSNISVVMLLESQYGFYIHGESIHAHADASMAEFQENLRREAQGNLPQRGLGGREECQVFEIYIGSWLRQGLNICYGELLDEYMKALGGAAGKPVAGKHRTIFEILTGSPGQVTTFTERTLEIKSNINDLFRSSVRRAEKLLRAKDPIHNYLDFTPNLLFMNGPFAGESAGGDIYFVDGFDAYAKCLLGGIDFDIFLLYVLLFCAIDSSVFNTYIGVGVVFILDFLFVWFRESQGQANLGAKTLFDERFFT